MAMDFVFINVREPKDALQLAKEPEIRSHVARYQWKQIENRPSHPTRKENAKAPEERPRSTCIDLGGSDLQARDGPFPTPFGVVQATTISIPPPLGGIRVDPFRSYPISFRPFLPQLVDHCKKWPSVGLLPDASEQLTLPPGIRSHEYGGRYPRTGPAR